MTADLLSVPELDSCEPEERVAAATVWATIAVIDRLTVQTHGGAAQRRVDHSLRELGHTKVELYEQVVSAIERGDWATLGVARGHPRPSELDD
jgi:hypothetical protein